MIQSSCSLTASAAKRAMHKNWNRCSVFRQRGRLHCWSDLRSLYFETFWTVKLGHLQTPRQLPWIQDNSPSCFSFHPLFKPTSLECSMLVFDFWRIRLLSQLDSPHNTHSPSCWALPAVCVVCSVLWGETIHRWTVAELIVHYRGGEDL